MNTKQCKGCHQVLPLDQFDTEVKNKDGKRGKCKECIRKYNSDYQRTKRNRKKLERLGINNLDQCKRLGFPYVIGRMVW